MPIESRDRVASRPSPARSGPGGRPPVVPRRTDGPGAGNRPRRSASARHRLARTLIVGGVVLALLVGVGVFVVTRVADILPTCTATIGDETYRITPEQSDNARTIADVAAAEGVPNHAVTVAIAAALQESKLHNISHGDRDSVGLFQQRPSQGWGTAEQLTTPRFAAAAFYRALVQVEGWETMSVTDAAQKVQVSAAPDAYAKWEAEARVLARILTGEVTNQIECA